MIIAEISTEPAVKLVLGKAEVKALKKALNVFLFGDVEARLIRDDAFSDDACRILTILDDCIKNKVDFK